MDNIQSSLDELLKSLKKICPNFSPSLLSAKNLKSLDVLSSQLDALNNENKVYYYITKIDVLKQEIQLVGLKVCFCMFH